MTDPNNAQSQRHGVIKRTIAGSLARSWPPPLCRRRCCVLLLRTAVEPACCCCSEKSLCSCVVSVVCRVFRLSFTFVSYARVRQCTPPRHGVVKRTIRGSLARSWPPPPPLPRRRRRCVLLLLLLGVAVAAANNRYAVLASAVREFRLLGVWVLAYEWNFFP